MFCNISLCNKESYTDSPLSGVTSELPLISLLVYLSPYADSPLSSVEHEVVICQGDDEYRCFLL